MTFSRANIVIQEKEVSMWYSYIYTRIMGISYILYEYTRVLIESISALLTPPLDSSSYIICYIYSWHSFITHTHTHTYIERDREREPASIEEIRCSCFLPDLFPIIITSAKLQPTSGNNICH